jgi:predicted phosphodiesterase
MSKPKTDSRKWQLAEERLVRVLLPTNTYREISEQINRRFDKQIPGFPNPRSEDAVRHKCNREEWTAESVADWEDPVEVSFEKLREIQAQYNSPQNVVHAGIIGDKADRKILSLSDIHFPLARIDLLDKVLDEHDDADILVLNGDILEGYVFSSFAKHRRIAAMHEYLAAYEFVDQVRQRFPRVVITGGNHDCLSQDTECFTNEGWKTYDSLVEGEWVLTLNNDTGETEWQQATNVHIYDHNGPMVRAQNDYIDMLITRNHRVMTKLSGPDAPKFAYTFASEFPATRTDVRVPVAAQANNRPKTDTPLAALAALGKMMRDPSILSDQDKELLLFELDITDVMYDVAPPILWDLSSGELEDVFRYASSHNGSSANKYVFQLNSSDKDRNQRIASSLEALLIQNGYASASYSLNGGNFKVSAVERNCETFHGGFAHMAAEVQYEGKVWCVTVPNSNFFVRRAGVSFFTGNSRVSRALKQGGLDQEALEILRPDLLARIANGERLDSSGMLIEKQDFDNVHYDRYEPWYARIGDCCFVHPHSKGSSKPGFTVSRTAQYLNSRYDDIKAVVCGHTHQLYWGVVNGQLMIEQGHLSGLMHYAHSPRLQFLGSTYNGYAVIYQDEDGNTDFNKSRPMYLGTALPPKKSVQHNHKDNK